MNINFEYIEHIPQILQLIQKLNEKVENKIEKRWLTINETSEYIGYSTDRIHKLKDIEFHENKHFYKKSGKLIFDKQELDNWIMGINQNYIPLTTQQQVNNILENLLAS